MSPDNDPDLSEKQQLLLSRYYDGECGFISRFIAKRLIASNSSALLFVSSLQRHAETFRGHIEDQQPGAVDLWSKIDARIEQEERAAFYLGNRRVEEPRWSLLGKNHSTRVVFGGVSGAALAALALFVANQPKTVPTFSVPPSIAFNSSQAFQPVGLGNSAQPLRTNPFTPVGTRGMEVDWMRSNGSLALIPDSNGTSTIIWVRRKLPRTGTPSLNSPLQPTPLGRAEPAATIAAKQQWLDGSTTTGNK